MNAKPKKVLLVNAVTWASPQLSASPLSDVARWYSRWLEDIPDFSLTSLSAETDVLGALLTGMDGVILSGSPRDAWNADPVNLKLCDLVLACRDRGVPFLGVCYGHQILARALSGAVAPHPQGLELGNTEVELTPAGRQSALCAGFPDRFEVLSSHADAVLELPGGCELLIRGEFTANQGFHWNHQLFGVQFHPETDPEILRFIWQPRLDRWRQKVSFDLVQRLESLRSTPAAGNFLRNFVNKIIV